MAPNNSNYSAEAIRKLESLFKILIKEQTLNQLIESPKLSEKGQVKGLTANQILREIGNN